MEEQKKTQGEAGGDSLFDGGFDTAVPERPWAPPPAQIKHLVANHAAKRHRKYHQREL